MLIVVHEYSLSATGLMCVSVNMANSHPSACRVMKLILNTHAVMFMIRGGPGSIRRCYVTAAEWVLCCRGAETTSWVSIWTVLVRFLITIIPPCALRVKATSIPWSSGTQEWEREAHNNELLLPWWRVSYNVTRGANPLFPCCQCEWTVFTFDKPTLLCLWNAT